MSFASFKRTFKALYSRVFFRSPKPPIRVENKFSWMILPFDPIETVFVKDGTNLPRHLRLLPFLTVLIFLSSLFVLYYFVFGINYITSLTTQPKAALFLEKSVFSSIMVDLSSGISDGSVFVSALQIEPSKNVHIKYDSVSFRITKLKTLNSKGKLISLTNVQSIIEHLRNPEFPPVFNMNLAISGELVLENSMIAFPVQFDLTAHLHGDGESDLIERLLHGHVCFLQLKGIFEFNVFDLFSIPIRIDRVFSLPLYPKQFSPSTTGSGKGRDAFLLQNGIRDAFKSWLHLQKLVLHSISDHSKYTFSLAQQKLSPSIEPNIFLKFPNFTFNTLISNDWNEEKDYCACKINVHEFTLRGIFKNGYFYFLKEPTPLLIDVDFVSLELFVKNYCIVSTQYYRYYFESVNLKDPLIVHLICRFLNEKFRPFEESTFDPNSIPLTHSINFTSLGNEIDLVGRLQVPGIPSQFSSSKFIKIGFDKMIFILKVGDEFTGQVTLEMDGFLWPIEMCYDERENIDSTIELYSYETINFHIKIQAQLPKYPTMLISSTIIQNWMNNLWKFKTISTTTTTSPIDYSVKYFTNSGLPSLEKGLIDESSARVVIDMLYDHFFKSPYSFRHDHLLQIQFVADRKTTPLVVPMFCFSQLEKEFMYDERYFNKKEPFKQIVIDLKQDFIFNRVIKAISMKMAKLLPLPNGQVPQKCIIKLASGNGVEFNLNATLNDSALVLVKASVRPFSVQLDFLEHSQNESSSLRLYADLFLRKTLKDALEWFNSIRAKPNMEFLQDYFGAMKKDNATFDHELTHQRLFIILNTIGLDDKQKSLITSLLCYLVKPIEFPSLTGILGSPKYPNTLVKDDYFVSKNLVLPQVSNQHMHLKSLLRIPLEKETLDVGFWKGLMLELFYDSLYKIENFKTEQTAIQIFLNRTSTMFTRTDSLVTIQQGSKRRYTWFPITIRFNNQSEAQMSKIGGCFFKGFKFEGLWKLSILASIPSYCSHKVIDDENKDPDFYYSKVESITSVTAPIFIPSQDKPTFNDISDTDREMDIYKVKLLVTKALVFFNPIRIYQMGLDLSSFEFHIVQYLADSPNPPDNPIILDFSGKANSIAVVGHVGLNAKYKYFDKVYITCTFGGSLIWDKAIETLKSSPNIRKQIFYPNSTINVRFSNTFLASSKPNSYQMIIRMEDSEPTYDGGYIDFKMLQCNPNNSLLVVDKNNKIGIVFRNSLFEPVAFPLDADNLYELTIQPPTITVPIPNIHLKDKFIIEKCLLTQQEMEKQIKKTMKLLDKAENQSKSLYFKMLVIQKEILIKGIYTFNNLESHFINPGLYKLLVKIKDRYGEFHNLNFQYYKPNPE